MRHSFFLIIFIFATSQTGFAKNAKSAYETQRLRNALALKCPGTSTDVKLICANPELRAWHARYQQLVWEMWTVADICMEDPVSSYVTDFVNTRKACSDVRCIKKSYTIQMKNLYETYTNIVAPNPKDPC